MEKKAERRRLILKRVSIAVGVVAFLAVAAWVLLFSSVLGLKAEKVQVHGLKGSDLTSAQIEDVMGKWQGAPTLNLPAEEIESGLIDAYPVIKSVDVGSKLLHGASITVELREPVACLVEEDGCVAIDGDGVKLDLPQKKADALPHLKLGEDESVAGTAANEMIDVLESLSDKTRERVKSIEVSDTLQITLKLSGKAKVLWGSSESNDFKSEVLDVLLQQKASTYDVSVPSAPVTE